MFLSSFGKKRNLFLMAVLLVTCGTLFTSSVVLAQFCRVCHKETTKQCGKCPKAEHAVFYCSENCVKADWPAHKQEHKYIESIKERVEIRPSNIAGAGRGLFAKTQIPPGATIAIYSGKTYKSNFEFQMSLGTNEYLQNESTDEEDGGPLVIGTGGLAIVGNQAISDDQAFFGAQMANDPMITAEQLNRLSSVNCANLSWEDFQFISSFAKEYVSTQLKDESTDHHRLVNANNDRDSKLNRAPFRTVFVAKRLILPGEEIYDAYGLDYWLGFPLSICRARGFPDSVLRIKDAASRGIDQVHLINKNPSKNVLRKMLFNGYLSPTEVESRRAKIMADPIPSRIAALFGSEEFFQIVRHLEANHFQKMVDELGILARLEEIASLPATEFSSSSVRHVVNPRSRSLLRDMMIYRDQHAKDISNGQLFTLLNMIPKEKKRELTAQEVSILLPVN